MCPLPRSSAQRRRCDAAPGRQSFHSLDGERRRRQHAAKGADPDNRWLVRVTMPPKKASAGKKAAKKKQEKIIDDKVRVPWATSPPRGGGLPWPLSARSSMLIHTGMDVRAPLSCPGRQLGCEHGMPLWLRLRLLPRNSRLLGTLPLPQTFGLKNKKKSKKVQAFVASVAKQVTEGSVRVRVSSPRRRCTACAREIAR